MRLTKFTDYALRVLMYAASRPDVLVTIDETAEAFGISRAHLKKVVLVLSNAGFILARRGRKGGFTLGRPPEEISLGAVVRLTEPDFGLAECFTEENFCTIGRVCRLPGVLNEALGAFIEVLDRYTLNDIMLSAANFGLVPAGPAPRRGPDLAPRPPQLVQTAAG